VPVKVEQIIMTTFSQTLTRSNKIKNAENESIARSVPGISVHVVEAEE